MAEAFGPRGLSREIIERAFVLVFPEKVYKGVRGRGVCAAGFVPRDYRKYVPRDFAREKYTKAFVPNAFGLRGLSRESVQRRVCQRLLGRGICPEEL